MRVFIRIHKHPSEDYEMNPSAKKEAEPDTTANNSAAEPWPAVSYRRAGRPELAGRKIIRCPYCAEVLIDVDRDKIVQTYRMPKDKRIKPIQGLEFRKCDFCKNEVGLVMK